jgi:hypothetical protein
MKLQHFPLRASTKTCCARGVKLSIIACRCRRVKLTNLVESPDFNKRAFRQPLKFHVPSHGRTDVTIWTRRKSRVQPGGVIHVNFIISSCAYCTRKIECNCIRDKRYYRHGWIILKFSKSNLKANPEKVIEQIRERLGQRKPCVPKTRP